MNQQNQPWNQTQNQPWNQNQAWGGQEKNLSDQELAFDLLYQEKALMTNIASEVLEASQPGLRQVMNDAYLQMGQDQIQLFNLMQQNGWYQTKPAQQPDIQAAKQKYQQMRGAL